jgi:hypothetical protein
MIMPKLKDCWVVLATLSAPLSSPHGTRPVSLNGVTGFLLVDEDVGDVPSEVCVA